MRLRHVFPAILFGCCILLFLSAFAGGNDVKKVPAVVVPEAVYTFPRVVDGTQVVHDFILKNRGSATLKIQSVKTG